MPTKGKPRAEYIPPNDVDLNFMAKGFFVAKEKGVSCYYKWEMIGSEQKYFIMEGAYPLAQIKAVAISVPLYYCIPENPNDTAYVLGLVDKKDQRPILKVYRINDSMKWVT